MSALAFVPATPVQAQTKAGIVARQFKIDTPYHWRDAKVHALNALVWYPADASAIEEPQFIGDPDAPLFDLGKAAPKAKVAPAPARFPLIVLSHGTGGTAYIMTWFGAALASRGYIVAALDHPGNNATADYTAKGFLLWWERARDLSVVIDKMLADPEFGPRIDPQRIGAAGYSLGGYTMMELAGGVTDLARFKAFCASTAADAICQSPPEFPDLMERFAKIDDAAKDDPEINESLRHSGDSYRDPRVRGVFAMAPALGPVFGVDTLKKISIPVEIVAGASDEIVPVQSGAKYLGASIPGSVVMILPGGAGHYVFVGTCTQIGVSERPELCTDARNVDRDGIHRKTIDLASEFFGRVLK